MEIKCLATFKDCYIILANNIDNEYHNHYALQLISGNSFNLFTKDKTYESQKNTIIVDSWVKHKLVSDVTTLVVLINPLSNLGLNVRTKLKDESVTNCDFLNFAPILNTFNNRPKVEGAINSLYKNLEGIFIKDDLLAKLDPRISDAIKKANDIPNIKLKQLISEAFLSESRFFSLMKKETGVSMKKFLVWKRLTKTLLEIATLNDRSISDILFDNEYNDFSHFSRELKTCFGLNTKKLKESSFLHNQLIFTL